MTVFVNQLWRVGLLIAHKCACLLFSITKPHIRGVFVAVLHGQKVLLIRNSYRKGWTLPGGLLAKSETWEQAAVRETFEEVGIQIDEGDLAFKTEVVGEFGPNDRAQMFEVGIREPVQVVIDEREVVAAEFVSLVEALDRKLNKHVRQYILTKVKGENSDGLKTMAE